MNPTNEPNLRSWIEVGALSPFPVQNLPYGAFRRGSQSHLGVAIGSNILDLTVASAEGLLDGIAGLSREVFQQPTLNAFAATGRPLWQAVRNRISQLLQASEATLRDDPSRREKVMVPQKEVVMQLPVEVGDYTDFYSSREHATNVGTMLRGADNALMPNWVQLPVAYHGRSSSIVISGTNIHRPQGQSKPADAQTPIFGPTRSLDFELEVGAIIGPGNALGKPIPIDQAENHIFGLVLVNDWSARDIQAWEYQPLGPFLSKNFATSISPWMVTLEALEPFRREGPKQDPQPLPYLQHEGKTTFDINLEVDLQSPNMLTPHTLSQSNFHHLYWSLAQQLTHHTVGGCPLRPGDLLASGTISGPTPNSLGCLLELTWRGTRPLSLPGGQTRKFLEDGDRITVRGWCEGSGYRIGFGEVTGTILPTVDHSR